MIVCSYHPVTPGQSAEEMPSIDVPNKENKDKDMFILHVIIQVVQSCMQYVLSCANF